MICYHILVKSLIFSTSNEGKYKTAQSVFSQYGIAVIQKTADVDEIQSEDARIVAIDKSTKTYELLKQPVLITDDSWSFPGLKGFPGVYMHSINTWFSPEDFLHLTQSLKNRRAIYTQYLVYNNGEEHKVFKSEHNGTLLKEIKGSSPHASHMIIAMDGENGLSIAEIHNKNVDRSKRDMSEAWHEFAKWFSKA